MSMRKAINDMCKSCIYDSFAAGSWRKQVEECTMPTCPLFEYRPVTAANRRENGPKQPVPEGLRKYRESLSE